MKGELAEGVVPALLRELYVGRRTGTLHFQKGDETQRVRVRRGHIVNAHTNVVEERLGEILVKRGLLSADDLARAAEAVVRDKKRLGEVLVDLGLMDQSGLEDAVALHVHGLLTKVFTWNEGTYFFEEEETEGDELTLKLSTAELLLEAVRAIRDPDVVSFLLGDLDRVVALSKDPLLRFQQLALSPTDGFVLSRVDDSLSAREIERLIPLPAEEVRRSLLGLVSTGIVDLRDPPAPGQASAKASGPRSPDPSATARPAPPSPAPPPPTPPGPPSPPSPAAAAPAGGGAGVPADDRRREVLEAYEGLKSKNHFEILGLPRASSAADVKEAYFRLARRFHPDVHHGASLGDLRDQLEEVFVRLGEAYEVLRDTNKRRDYEERLGRLQHRAGHEATTPGGADTGPPPPDPEEEARQRQQALLRAERLYEQEEYFDAIQLARPLVDTVPDELKARARLVLARSYLKNPNWAKDAEQILLDAVRDDPKAAAAYLLLGGLYRDRGLRARATSMFRRVVELRPDDEEAKRQLATLEPGPPPPEDEGGGLLRKIFKRS